MTYILAYRLSEYMNFLIVVLLKEDTVLMKWKFSLTDSRHSFSGWKWH